MPFGREGVVMEQTGDSAVVAAISWIEQILSGSAASILATIAIASVGFLMLAGRIDVRRAGVVVLGCFMIFSATSIAQGILAAARGETAPLAASAESSPPPAYPRPPAGPVAPPQKGHDPYAAVAVPQQ